MLRYGMLLGAGVVTVWMSIAAAESDQADGLVCADREDCARRCDRGERASCNAMVILASGVPGWDDRRGDIVRYGARGCRLGAGESCWSVGMIRLAEARLTDRPGAALDDFGRGCAARHAASCTQAGAIVEQATVRSGGTDYLAWYEAGCALGHAHACTRVAFAYELGLRVPRDLGKAAAFYERACRISDPMGCQFALSLVADDAHGQLR